MIHDCPKVSVIVPIYNGEPYVDRCLKGITGQTVSDIEILLMVGPGDDTSLEQCIQWQREDERVILFSRRDKGLGDARNYGLMAARGTYIAFVDVDDAIEPDFLEKMTAPLEMHDEADITCCGFDRVWEDGTSREGWIPGTSGKMETTISSYYEKIYYGVVWNKVYRRSWLLERDILQFAGCHEDDAMHLMLAAQVKSVYFVREELYHYNCGHPGSLMQDQNNRLQYFDAMEFSIGYLKRHGLFEENQSFIFGKIRDRMYAFFLDMKGDPRFPEAAERLCETYFKEDYNRERLRIENLKRAFKEKIVMFGAGHDGMELLKEIGSNRVSGLIDNNPVLKGTNLNGVPVYSLDEYIRMEMNADIVISSSKYCREMERQLLDAGIRSYYTAADYLLKRQFKDVKKRIILMNTPVHTNIGDHAIAEAEQIFIRKYLPQYEVTELTEEQCLGQRYVIKQLVRQDDVIAITGGGFLGSLWMKKAEQNVRNILWDYGEQKIVIFPQTLFFEHSAYGQYQYGSSKQYYTSCRNLTIFLREKRSYDTARELAGDCARCYLVPDIVLSVGAWGKPEQLREGAALCLKSNQESVLTADERRLIETRLVNRGFRVLRTTMYDCCKVSQKNREERIKGKLRELQSYALVITDALHCMIFCALSGTPCVAINNISRKLEGVYQWISELDYIAFAEGMEYVDACIDKVLSAECTRYIYNYGPYFKLLRKAVEDES